ncbi:hypothetical protein D039_2809B, partial [Vibrio parahaemolyticus EKP-028]
VSLLPVESEG